MPCEAFEGAGRVSGSCGLRFQALSSSGDIPIPPLVSRFGDLAKNA
jgi:hypothetical protein